MSTAVPPSGVVSIRLSGEIKQRLDTLSQSTGRPASYYVREAINAHLAEMEWAYSVAARAERVRQGEEETFSQADIDRDLGITGEPVDMSILDEIE